MGEEEEDPRGSAWQLLLRLFPCPELPKHSEVKGCTAIRNQ